MARIVRLVKKVSPERQSGLSERNSSRLRQLAAPRKRAMLLHLPQQLMHEAADESLKPAAAARLALQAVALEILLICPMRISNLAALHLDRHLSCDDPRAPHRISCFVVPGTETKNRVALNCPLPEETTRLIQTYLQRYHPTLADPANHFLFPGQGPRTLSVNSLRIAICQPVAERIGAEIHPHLLRHYAACSYLRENPGAYETVRRLLGHKSIESTIAYYTGLEAEFAAQHFDATVLKERRATRATAAAAFRQDKVRLRRRKGQA